MFVFAAVGFVVVFVFAAVRFVVAFVFAAVGFVVAFVFVVAAEVVVVAVFVVAAAVAAVASAVVELELGVEPDCMQLDSIIAVAVPVLNPPFHHHYHPIAIGASVTVAAA